VRVHYMYTYLTWLVQVLHLDRSLLKTSQCTKG